MSVRLTIGVKKEVFHFCLCFLGVGGVLKKEVQVGELDFNVFIRCQESSRGRNYTNNLSISNYDLSEDVLVHKTHLDNVELGLVSVLWKS